MPSPYHRVTRMRKQEDRRGAQAQREEAAGTGRVFLKDEQTKNQLIFFDNPDRQAPCPYKASEHSSALTWLPHCPAQFPFHRGPSRQVVGGGERGKTGVWGTRVMVQKGGQTGGNREREG